MDDFKLAFFCFLLLICYFITTFSLINAVPFRHCVLCFFFFNYFTQFDSSSFVFWLTFQFISLLVTFLFWKKKRNCANLRSWKVPRLFRLWPPFCFYLRWAQQAWKSWQCVLEVRTNCQTSFLTSKKKIQTDQAVTRGVDTKFTH